MSRDEWIEQNRDALEKRYYEAYMLTLEYGVDENFKQFEQALVALGILEDDEPEANSEGTRWDEWIIDNAIDRLREDRMAYEM